MKGKQLCWGVLLVLCILCSGCSKKRGAPEDNANIMEEEEETKETFLFGFSGMSMEDPYFIILEASLREKLEEEQCSLVTKDPKRNQELQNQQIDEMIEEGIQGIFLSPVDWEGITPALERLKEAGVRIINIDSQVKERHYADAYIGTNNIEAGTLIGEDLIRRFPEGGKIMILESPVTNSINERITGFETTIANAGFEVIERMDGKGDLGEALTLTEDFLKKGSDVTAIVCGNDPMALGALVAVNKWNSKETTREQKNAVIYGVGGSPDLKKELAKKNSLIGGTAAQSPIHLGIGAAQIGLSILRDEDYEKEVLEDSFFIDRENVSIYGMDGWQ